MERVAGSVDAVLDAYGMSQVELAAALNVTQAAISQWSRGVRRPTGEAARSIDRASYALEMKPRYYDVGLRRGPVIVPVELWEPAFRPSGKFRLPLRIEWSGSDESRWRDAASAFDVLDAYVLVMSEGRISDIGAWVDPAVLARSVDDVLWPRGYRDPWVAALSEWGLV
jgi:transcriptional regulator with XRE-family HTH domain